MKLNSVEVRRWCRFSGRCWWCWRDGWCCRRRSSCWKRLFHTNRWTNLTGLVTSKVHTCQNMHQNYFPFIFPPLSHPHVFIFVIHASTVIILKMKEAIQSRIVCCVKIKLTIPSGCPGAQLSKSTSSTECCQTHLPSWPWSLRPVKEKVYVWKLWILTSHTYLPALCMNQIFLEHGQAGQESVLLLRLDLGQVTTHVLTKLLALSPGEASGCKGLLIWTYI